MDYQQDRTSHTAYSTLVHRYHEQVYRLALLVGGDASAAALVKQAFSTIEIDGTDPQMQLIYGLLPRHDHRKAWRRRLERADLLRANLDHAKANVLLRELATLTPAERLLIGIHYILGTPLDELPMLTRPIATQATPSELLSRFRGAVARGIGPIPPEIDDVLLVEIDQLIGGELDSDTAANIRRVLFEQPELRAIRDSLGELRALLPRAIPALFATQPPPELLRQLLDSDDPEEQQKPRHMTLARLGTTAAVLITVLAIVLTPSLLAPHTGDANDTPEQNALELIEAAIHRFERPQLQHGILHEVYRLQVERQAVYQIERWYDYAAPHRMHVQLRQEASDTPLVMIGTDGHSLVQYRFSERRAINARVSEAEARALIPLLRNEPLAGGPFRFEYPPDLAGLYLAQARTSQPVFLGTARFLDRPAFLTAYETMRLPIQGTSPGTQQLRVVLTIDAQTYTLLDVTVIPPGDTESIAFHPLQATTLEVLDSVPDQQFKLPDSPSALERTGLPSVGWPDLPNEVVLSLQAARETVPDLLVPSDLPAPDMRGLAIATDAVGQNDIRVALLYESEFQSLIIFPDGQFFPTTDPGGEERQVGHFRYRMMPPPWPNDLNLTTLLALVSPQDNPDRQISIILTAPYVAASERERLLERVIASLTHITEQNLAELQVNFYSAAASDGES